MMAAVRTEMRKAPESRRVISMGSLIWSRPP
jgi:hypothetical protein